MEALVMKGVVVCGSHFSSKLGLAESVVEDISFRPWELWIRCGDSGAEKIEDE